MAASNAVRATHRLRIGLSSCQSSPRRHEAGGGVYPLSKSSNGSLGRRLQYMVPFRTVCDQGYWLKPAGARATHSFCGPQSTPGAVCPNCRKPLLRFLRLDRRDARLGICSTSSGFLPFFFCWRCNVAQEKFYYRVGDESVELLKWGKKGVERDFPYPDYLIFFPHTPVDLKALLPIEQHTLELLNRGIEPPRDLAYLEEPSHQVGGEPYLLQQNLETTIECVGCGAAMPFLGCIADDAFGKGKFTGNPYVQVVFHFCPRCEVICAYHNAIRPGRYPFSRCEKPGGQPTDGWLLNRRTYSASWAGWSP